MRTTADTSVLVAAFASWHEHHARAAAALATLDFVVAHCLLETYSVLTRLPAPHRIAPATAAAWLRMALGTARVVALGAAEQRKLVQTCVEQSIAGGAVYDAVIAATSARFDARLLTLDARARGTYARLGAAHEMVA